MGGANAGNGGDSSPSTSGVANRGGGGGGGGGSGGTVAGGSGTVVIRYANTYANPASTTGSPTVTNVGGYKIYTWTTVGAGSITF
jgi:hypothetical protein